MNFKLSKKSKTVISLLLVTILFTLHPLAKPVPDKVIPGGNTMGVKLYTDGLLVVGFSEILSFGKYCSPGKNCGIFKGDIITAADGQKLKDSDALAEYIQSTKGQPITLNILRQGQELTKNVTPVYYNDAGLYKLGIWVRESAAGIGTVTFINPESGAFGALGHGVSDSDTGTMLRIKDGCVTDCSISSITRGERGYPGELQGAFSGEDRGSISKNLPSGIYGRIYSPPQAKAVPVAHHSEVRQGKVLIYSDAPTGTVTAYTAEIQRIIKSNIKNSKGLVIKITDPRLIDKTGGIVQGMSGSPIIQNGRIVGAVTHVFVNDPTRGYGIFIENMLAEAEKIK
ncbi:MAG: SpoIVB peptidase [Clostridia bacterium]|nr:SpoIVB peptidase [Clostridia bacterium]